MSQLDGIPFHHEECSYENAAVAADSPESSAAGTSIMRDEDGSAVDAAIAGVLCSGVVNAHSCGIGGGAIITYYERSTGQVHTIIGRDQAPYGLQPDIFLDDLMSKRLGGLSICIPGEVLALYKVWKLGGRLPWRDLFQPAINLCKNGIIVRTALANAIDAVVKNDSLPLKEKVPDFLEFLTNPETGQIYKKGDRMYRPDLAKTLEKIATEGSACFYNGSLTDDIISDIKDANGILSKEDLANYTAAVKPPLALKLNEDLTVFSPPLPTSGVLYQFILNLLKGFKFNGSSVSTAEKSVITWHRITEAFKHAAAIRQHLGDNETCAVEIKKTINEAFMKARDVNYVKSIRAQMIDTKTFDAAYYYHLYNGVQHEDHGTSHLSVLGPNGDAVSVTSTISLYFGSKVVGARTGIVFNDSLRNFSLPNVKNRYNGQPLNSNLAEPLRRPLTAMCPSIVVDNNGDVKLVIGASGANRIPTSMALVTLETLWFDWSIKQAIDYPRIHHQLYPPEICCQPGFPQELIEGLQNIGHKTTDINSFSVVQGILRAGDKITAYSDYRKEGKPDGF